MNRFEEIYNENYPTMYCVATKMVNDCDAVPDIVQEVFVYLYECLSRGHIIHHPKSWLYRATINKSIDHLRKQKKYLGVESINDCCIGEDESLEKKESQAAIAEALSKLKHQERILAVLYSEGLSYREIAEISGVRFSSVGKMLSRTLKKIEKELKKQHYELY